MAKNIVAKALLIGINYRGSNCELRGCINDVNMMKEILINKYGYKIGNILLLTDDTIHKPTTVNILEAFEWLVSKNSATDFKKTKYIPLSISEKFKGVFQYSGHGSQLKDKNGDEKDGLDETICPINYLTGGMITDDIIREKLACKISKNGKLTCIVDACHSESSLDLLWTMTNGNGGSMSVSKVGNYQPTNGEIIMISGCKDNQTSADITINGKGNGALTYSLLQILKSNNYKITCDKLLNQARNYIKNNRLSDQIPCISLGKLCDVCIPFDL